MRNHGLAMTNGKDTIPVVCMLMLRRYKILKGDPSLFRDYNLPHIFKTLNENFGAGEGG